MSPAAATLSLASSPTQAQLSDDPKPHSHKSPISRNLIVIVCSLIGVFLVCVFSFTMWHWRRKTSRRRVHFYGRSATPLPDAEFDRWRSSSKPSVYKSSGTTVYKTAGTRLETYDKDGKTSDPIVAVMRVDVACTDRPRTPPQNTFRKSEEAQPSPSNSTRYLIRNDSVATNMTISTKHSRQKSSISIQDRPPTPHSIRSHPFGCEPETPTHTSPTLPQSPRQREHRVHVHYPSVSEVSDFDFGLDSGPQSPRQLSHHRRESFVHQAQRHARVQSTPTSPLIKFDGFQLMDVGPEHWRKRDQQ